MIPAGKNQLSDNWYYYHTERSFILLSFASWLMCGHRRHLNTTGDSQHSAYIFGSASEMCPPPTKKRPSGQWYIVPLVVGREDNCSVHLPLKAVLPNATAADMLRWYMDHVLPVVTAATKLGKTVLGLVNSYDPHRASILPLCHTTNLGK